MLTVHVHGVLADELERELSFYRSHNLSNLPKHLGACARHWLWLSNCSSFIRVILVQHYSFVLHEYELLTVYFTLGVLFSAQCSR